MKKIISALTIIVVLLFMPTHAQAAGIAFVSGIARQAPANNTTFTTSSINCTGANYVVVGAYNGSAGTDITDMKWGSSLMTLRVNQHGTGGNYASLWTFANGSDLGSNTITMDRSPSGSIRFAAACYSGTLGSDTIDTSGFVLNPASGNNNISVTSCIAGDWGIMTKASNANNPTGTLVNGSAGGTTRNGDVIGTDWAMSDSNASLGAAGSVSVGYVQGSADTGGVEVAIFVSPSACGGGTVIIPSIAELVHAYFW